MTVLERARAALDAGEPETAARLAAEALLADPESADAFAVSSFAWLLQGDHPAAERAARSGLAAVPGDPRLLLLLGAALQGQQRFEEALERLDAVLAVMPDLSLASVIRAECLLGMGKTADAEGALRTAVFYAPEDPLPLSRLAQVILERDPVEAEPLFRKALMLRPESAIDWNDLGVSLLRQGKRAPAKEAFVAAVEADDRLIVAKQNAYKALAYDRAGGIILLSLFLFDVAASVYAGLYMIHHDQAGHFLQGIPGGIAIAAAGNAPMILFVWWRNRRKRQRDPRGAALQARLWKEYMEGRFKLS